MAKTKKRRPKRNCLVEIARSFSFKLNLGNYQMADFFCSEKAEVPEKEAVKKSEALYQFCKSEVLKSVEEYKEEYKNEAAKSAILEENKSPLQELEIPVK